MFRGVGLLAEVSGPMIIFLHRGVFLRLLGLPCALAILEVETNNARQWHNMLLLRAETLWRREIPGTEPKPRDPESQTLRP